MDIKLETDDILIEELDSYDVPESELSEFQETQPLEVVAVLPDNLKNEFAPDEGTLIKRFMQGEVDLPNIYTELEPGEELEDVEELEMEEMDVDDEQFEAKPAMEPFSDIQKSCSESQKVTEITERSRGRPPFRKRTVLNSTLQCLMGEANLSYARGQVNIAEKVCLEIIRQNPLAPDPFLTLADIYETRDPEKYLNFLTIAAHLDPHDRDQWIRLAEIHIARGNKQRARVYYTKAIRVFPKDFDLRLRKGQLLESLGETNIAMLTYLKMIHHIPPEHAELCLMMAKKVAGHFYALSKHKFALEAMKAAYQVCPQLFTMEDINLYLELLITNKSYGDVLYCLRERTSLILETEQENNLEIILVCVIPDNLLPELRSKLCVCLIHFHAFHLLAYIINNIHEHIPIVEDRLELYVDIAEALMQEQKYTETIALLKPVTDGKIIECPAFVWLRRAECMRHLNETDNAIEDFRRVVELAPFCYEAKFTLSALLKQQGRNVEAVKALQQPNEFGGEPLNARLLYERCVMLQQIGEIDEFLEVGCVLLGRQSIKFRNREEIIAIANGGGFYNAESIKVLLKLRNITEDSDKVLQDYTKPLESSDLTVQDEYDLFLELIKTGFAQRKLNIVQRLCLILATTKRFTPFYGDLGRIIILACNFNNDYTIAFAYLRDLITKDPDNMALWNLLSLLVQKHQDLRYFRFVRRLLQRQPCSRKLGLFLAHYHLHCSSYKYALNIYVPLFKEQQDPLIAFCIAVVFSQISMQKKVLRKSAGITQAILFFHRYAVLRGGLAKKTSNPCALQQEIYYNIGRIYHQVGLMHIATEYYQRALSVRHPLIDANEKYMGLQSEIAFNLHLICRANGNIRKARQYLYHYCEV